MHIWQIVQQILPKSVSAGCSVLLRRRLGDAKAGYDTLFSTHGYFAAPLRLAPDRHAALPQEAAPRFAPFL